MVIHLVVVVLLWTKIADLWMPDENSGDLKVFRTYCLGTTNVCTKCCATSSCITE